MRNERLHGILGAAAGSIPTTPSFTAAGMPLFLADNYRQLAADMCNDLIYNIKRLPPGLKYIQLNIVERINDTPQLFIVLDYDELRSGIAGTLDLYSFDLAISAGDPYNKLSFDIEKSGGWVFGKENTAPYARLILDTLAAAKKIYHTQSKGKFY